MASMWKEIFSSMSLSPGEVGLADSQLVARLGRSLSGSVPGELLVRMTCLSGQLRLPMGVVELLWPLGTSPSISCEY